MLCPCEPSGPAQFSEPPAPTPPATIEFSTEELEPRSRLPPDAERLPTAPLPAMVEFTTLTGGDAPAVDTPPPAAVRPFTTLPLIVTFVSVVGPVVAMAPPLAGVRLDSPDLLLLNVLFAMLSVPPLS